MVTAERQKRIRNMKIFGGVMGAFSFFGMWAATQLVARDCGYLPAIGKPLTIGTYHIYWPWDYFIWQSELAEVIPGILEADGKWLYFALVAGFFLSVFIIKHSTELTTHGTAAWAKEKDIKDSGLTGNPGVILGIDPYTKKLLRDDGPAHIFLMAPTRSGKGVGVIIPTCLTWTHSIFVTDVKGENWQKTAGYRKMVMGHKCIKFAPLENDGSSARWNPLAEIRYRTIYEGSDLETVAGILINPKGENKDSDYWPQAGKILLKGAILHHLYQFDKENRPLPNLTNVLTFLSNIQDALETMATYPHISVSEFLAPKNIYQQCYSDNYITNFEPYENAIRDAFGKEVTIRSVDELKEAILACGVKLHNDARKEQLVIQAEQNAKLAAQAAEEADERAQAVAAEEEELQQALLKAQDDADTMENSEEKEKAATEVVRLLREKAEVTQECEKLYRQAAKLGKIAEKAEQEYQSIEKEFQNQEQKIDFNDDPWCDLLVHPKVRECATSMLDKAKDEMSGVQSTAATCLNLYQDPIVQKNTSVSDFRLKDLLDPEQPVSFFLVIPPNDLATLTPLVRLLVNLMFNKLIRDMKDEHVKGCKRQRLLMMLDEFPQFGKFETVENALAVCASYGIKMCIVAQNIQQLRKAYSRDQAVMGNCHTQVYYAPNDDGSDTAKIISDLLGNETIVTENKSDGGGGLFKGSISRSEIARKLMTPDEVSRMPKEKEIVKVAGHLPIYADKLFYFKDKRFLERSWSPDNPKYPFPAFSDCGTCIDSFDEMRRVMEPELREQQEKVRKVLEARKELEEHGQSEDLRDNRQSVSSAGNPEECGEGKDPEPETEQAAG